LGIEVERKFLSIFRLTCEHMPCGRIDTTDKSYRWNFNLAKPISREGVVPVSSMAGNPGPGEANRLGKIDWL
jgi:hypothetical protein